ncbi:hypothetical protein HMPREF1570_1491 [Klebsiella oxytoca KA-2]|nr:hypothetical protein HMPREF1570_1491 [Klebsiella oxytoca KA-2]
MSMSIKMHLNFILFQRDNDKMIVAGSVVSLNVQPRVE